MILRLLTNHQFAFLSFNGGCTCSYESTLATLLEITCCGSNKHTKLFRMQRVKNVKDVRSAEMIIIIGCWICKEIYFVWMNSFGTPRACVRVESVKTSPHKNLSVQIQ